MPVPKADEPDDLTDPRRSDVDEWGRSEHMREIARRVYGPIYRNWYRVEWEGLEQDPRPRAVRCSSSNHAGAIPADAPAIMHGIETELGRPVYGLADEMFKRLPVVGTMWSRVGGVLAHPDNAYRLLREQQQLALVFPEGTKGTGKPYSERYQLRRFGRGGFVQIAMRAGVPVDPDRRGRRRGGDADPLEEQRPGQAARRPVRADHRQHARLRPARAARCRAHPAGQDQDPGARPGALRRRARPAPLLPQPDHGRVGAHPAADPGGAARHAPPAPVGLVRVRWASASSSPASAPSGAAGSPRRSRPTPTVDVIVGLDRHEPTVPLERTEYVRSDESYSILARIVKAARIDTIIHTFLVVDSTQMRSRTIHEINVIGTMNLFAAASAPGSTVRNVVVKSSTLVYGADPKDPVWFTEESRRAQPPKAMVERSLLEVEGYVRDFAVDNPHVTVALLRFSNVLGPDITTPLAKALELPLVPAIFGFDPRFQFVHEADVVRAILFVLDGQVQGIYNVAGDGLAALERGGGDLRQADLPAPARRHGPAVARPLPRLGPRPPTGAARPAAPRPRGRQPAPQAGRLRLPLHLGRHRGRLRGGAPRSASVAGSSEAGLPVRARRRAVLPPLPRRHPRTSRQ